MTDDRRRNLSDRLRSLSPAQEAALRAKLTARRGRASEGPLSFTQQRQWFLDQLEPGNPTYNSPIAVRIEGRFDPDAFENAINRVIARHEMLRTRFVTRDGQPVQIVEPRLTIAIEREEVCESELEDRLRAAANRSFDLSVLPLVRANLFRLGPEDHALLVTMHHIVADGWSLGLFVHEVVHHYYFPGDPLPALGAQYLDYVRWERSRTDSREMTDELEWWLEQLDGSSRAISPFVPDRKALASADYRGTTYSFELGTELVDTLTSLAASKQTTLFVVLVSGLAALLSRWSAQTEIMLGTPVAHRPTREAQALIGLFVNTLVLRLGLSGNPSSLELVERTKNTVEQALAHQNVPFERIVKSLNPRRGSETSPLFRVMVTYFNEPTRDYLDFPGVKWRPIEINRGWSYRDLTLRMGMLQTKFVVDIEYKTELFNPETIENLALQLKRVLGQIASTPATTLDDLAVDFVSAKPEARPSWTGAGRRLFQRVLQQPKTVELERESVREQDRFGVPDWPLVYTATSSDVHLPAWFQKNRQRIRRMLHRHGAILWRGFGIRSAEQFLALARAMDAQPLDYSEKSTPRTQVLEGVYTSTEYPADQNIMLHNECAYFTRWPSLIFFCCLKPAERGGATTIGDMRKVYRRIDPAVRHEMTRRGVLYVRNFHTGTDLSWQEVYQTDDRERVNEIGRTTGAEMIWREDGGLSTRRKLPAVMHHPVTRDPLWFNSAHMFHVASHRPAVRDALRSLYHDLLPRQAYYGDGGVIPDDVIEHLHEVYRAHIVPVHYRAGDVLLIDNLLTLHGREPFTGTREVLVIMS